MIDGVIGCCGAGGVGKAAGVLDAVNSGSLGLAVSGGGTTMAAGAAGGGLIVIVSPLAPNWGPSGMGTAVTFDVCLMGRPEDFETVDAGNDVDLVSVVGALVIVCKSGSRESSNGLSA
jgi:hypothetical protein